MANQRSNPPFEVKPSVTQEDGKFYATCTLFERGVEQQQIVYREADLPSERRALSFARYLAGLMTADIQRGIIAGLIERGVLLK